VLIARVDFGSNFVILDKFYYKIKDYYNKYKTKIKTIVIESISGFQVAYENFVKRNRIEVDGLPFESKKHHTGAKNTRLQMTLEPALRSSKLLLPNDTITKAIINNNYVNPGLLGLIEELRFFDIKNENTNKDDMIDALALAVDKVDELENVMSYKPRFKTVSTSGSRKKKYNY
jgi:hypothetical protein